MPDLEKVEAELRACPFCGSDGELVNGGPGNWYVRCMECRATGDDGTPDYALSRWNRRASLSEEKGR